MNALKDLNPNIQELTIKNMVPEDVFNDKANNELNKIKETGQIVDRENLIYRGSEYTYSFKNLKDIFW